MNKTLVAAAAVLLGVAAAGLGTASLDSPASATKPDGEHKVWICHATSGDGELKNGYNLIHVDTSSTQYQAHLAHATTDPKVNRQFGTPPDFHLYDMIDVDPAENCGGVEPPPVTPEEPPVVPEEPPVIPEEPPVVPEDPPVVPEETGSEAQGPLPPATGESPAAAGPAAPAPATLPTTGSSSWAIFLIGLASVMSGAGLVAASRRQA